MGNKKIQLVTSTVLKIHVFAGLFLLVGAGELHYKSVVITFR